MDSQKKKKQDVKCIWNNLTQCRLPTIIKSYALNPYESVYLRDNCQTCILAELARQLELLSARSN